ncbi:MAG: hypothetical protein QOI66_5525 [Myxococcales bacterium]|jgi:hypothetical protein|nr:hypothetical protein [Myxococcales bacterium]
MNRPPVVDSRTRISRRRLLRGMGATAVALTSPIWRPATAFGASAPGRAAKRFIGIFSANGTIPSAFFPSGTAQDSPLTFGRILAPLEAYKDKTLVLKGVHMISTIGPNKPGGPHMKGPGAMLTGGSLLPGSFSGAQGPAGWADRASVDFAIRERIGGTTTFKSLEFGVRTIGQEPLRCISYGGPSLPNLPVQDPWAMFTRMFANADLSSTQLKLLMAQRKSIIDFLKDDISHLKARISNSDKARLDAHLTGVAGLEQELNNAANSCTPPMMPAKIDPGALGNFATIGQLQTSLMVLAHSCNLTKVSTFMWSNADSWQFFPFCGVNEEHHGLSHSGDNDAVANEKLVKINVWHAEQVASLLDKLAAAPDVNGGTVLDNTLLLWGNELGVGNSHTYKDIPWVMVGGGGYFKTGRYLQYKDQPHNNLLVSVCNAMGMDDVKTFGIPELSTGPLPGLTA